MATRCKSCGGSYSAQDARGVTYFHACAPRTVQGAQPDPLKPGFTPPTSVELPNKRDENFQTDAAGKATGTVSAGDGVEEV